LGQHDGGSDMNRPKSVLVVDDSRSMRAWLRLVLEADPRLEVCAEASSAIEAREVVKARYVDVLTLDVAMPGMDGLEFLQRLMRARPMPVVMMSSLTSQGSDAAVQALSLGAIDCMVKPTRAYDAAFVQGICDRVYAAACTRPQYPKVPAAPAVRAMGGHRPGAIILIGASTGGVAALEAVLPQLDPKGPPVVIVQHMPENFLQSFSARLNRDLTQNVGLATAGMVLHDGDIAIAPSNGCHTEILKRDRGWVIRHAADDENALHCPSVDRLFSSAAGAGGDIVAAILTGLGRDGADGLVALARTGARTIGQDEASSVVYGMPRAAFEQGGVQTQMPLERIGAALRAACMGAK
jgi:two-component system chemotaxis response regulator CheB